MLLAVGLYIVAWLVTARVGAPSVRQALSSGMSPTIQDVSGSDVEPEGPFPAWYYCRTSSPLPFIVSVKIGFSAPQMDRVHGELSYI